MKFSIIVPAYNADIYLAETLDSIERQTYTDFETVLVDDGSTDRTGILLDEFAARHGGAHVIHCGNNGLLLARRTGLKRAQGDYIVFLDADDLLRQDALELCARALAATDVDIVAFRHTTNPNNWKPADQLVLPKGIYNGQAYRQVTASVCEGHLCSIWGKAIRRSCFDIDSNYEPYRGLMHGEDIFTVLPVFDAASSLVQLDRALIYYRLHEGSSTACFRSSQLHDLDRVAERMRRYAQAWGYSEDLAAKGEMLQYLYLARIAAHSPLSVHDRDAALAEIRQAMFDRGVFQRIRRNQLRLDYRLIAWLLAGSHERAARLVIRIIDATKKVFR